MINVKKQKTLLYALLMLIPLLLLSITSSSLVFGSTVENKVPQSIHIGAKVGYDGQYQVGTPTPVFVTLKNSFDRDIKGDLVFNISTDHGNTVSHVVPVEIVSGSEIQLTMNVDGNFGAKLNSFQFFEGNMEKGKLLDVTGDINLVGKSVGSSTMIGIISSDPDTLNFLLLLKGQGYDLSTVILKEDFVAETSDSLEMFKVLVLNDVITSTWSEQKVDALKDWVAKGGTLLVGGGANYGQTMKAIEDIVPVSGQNTTTLADTSAIDQFALSENPLGPIQITQGTLTRGESFVTSNNNPIVARNTVGKGTVFYTAFDLGLKPFSVWEGRTTFIQTLLSESLIPTAVSGNYYYDDPSRILQEAVNFFPRLEAPPVMILMLVFAIYVFLIAPILYLILKRVDKREWAWWIIPASAVLTTFIVIYLGAMNKTENYVHSVDIIEQSGDTTIVRGIGSVFLASNKDISIDVPSNQYVKLSPTNSYGNNNPLKSNKEHVIRYDGDHKELQWNENKYWTTRSFLKSPTVFEKDEFNQIDVSIENRNDQFILIIQNNTGVDLSHLSFINGGNVEVIGQLDNGESTELPLTSPLQFTTGNPYRYSYGSQIFAQSSNYWKEYARESALIDNGASIGDSLKLVGFSYSDQSLYQVNNKKVKTDQLTMWNVNLVDLILEQMPDSYLVEPIVTSEESASLEMQGENSFYLFNGAILLTYQLNGTNTANATASLQPIIDPYYFNNFNMSFYNETTQAWDKYSGEPSINIADYLNDKNALVLRIESINGGEGVIPTLLVEGESQ
ncbi:DUF7408 domain-containing protein [Paenibacillus endoradicis]|uniref:DUF7408 domain-containing protein n=1 Tax=Paenibacillus endoradicis TaxID=2972487 RepID=UPI0021593A10|nr:hypothetical protein [Paenibacillus endoradicis]MCR8656349.1 hypothetical protein [Paenibacillus endoradicis]